MLKPDILCGKKIQTFLYQSHCSSINTHFPKGFLKKSFPRSLPVTFPRKDVGLAQPLPQITFKAKKAKEHMHNPTLTTCCFVTV